MTRTLTRDQVREVDRAAVAEFGMHGLVLMENAGRNAADIVDAHLAESDRMISRVLIFCGRGNNGGDGFVIARHLSNRGRTVRVVLVADPDRLSPDAKANYGICTAMKICMLRAESVEGIRAIDIQPDDLLVDALLGTGFRGAVREPLASLIHRINATRHGGVVAIDVPSGLDCDTGVPADACVRADVTVTFVASKAGFERGTASDYVGRCHVVDIGVPRELVDRIAVV